MPREILKGYVPSPQVFEKDCRAAMYAKEHCFKAGQAWAKFGHCHSLAVNFFTRKVCC